MRKSTLNVISKAIDSVFREEDHPRGDDGKFTSGESGSASSESDNNGTSLKFKNNKEYNLKSQEYLDKGQVLVPDLKGGFKIVDVDSDEFEYAKRQIFGSLSNFKKLVSRLRKMNISTFNFPAKLDEDEYDKLESRAYDEGFYVEGVETDKGTPFINFVSRW